MIEFNYYCIELILLHLRVGANGHKLDFDNQGLIYLD